MLATHQFVKKSTYEELKLTMTIRLCGNGPQDGEMSGFEFSLLVTLSETGLPSLPLLLLVWAWPPVDSNGRFLLIWTALISLL